MTDESHPGGQKPAPKPSDLLSQVPGAAAPQASAPASPSGEKVRVIDSLWTFAVAVAVLGPFALPLLWRNPRFSRNQKLAGTAFVVVLTVVLLLVTGESFKKTYEEYKKTVEMLHQMQGE